MKKETPNLSIDESPLRLLNRRIFLGFSILILAFILFIWFI